MRFAVIASVAALAAVFTAPPAARAQAADEAGAIARQIQDGCVRRGEDARVCACGVGIAYSKLDPSVFALIPQLDPLIDERNTMKQITGVAAVASSSHISAAQAQEAYNTIRANRATVRQICTPLAAK